MASVKSRFRALIKPALYRLLGESGYEYFQYLGKLKDIRGRLVEEAEMELFPRFVGPEDEVLDIGANYAYHSHRIAALCPRGRVFAFEPIPFTYRVCRRILKHYRLDNVNLYQKGVGALHSEECFRVPVVDFGGISGGQSHLAGRNNELDGKERHYGFRQSREVVCSVIAIDTFLPELTNLTFVKMDIEGAEFFALQGMQATLKRFQPVIMLEINPFFLDGYNIAERDLRGLLGDLNYSLYLYKPDRRRLQPYGQEPCVEANYLALTPEHEEKFADLLEREAFTHA